VHILFLLGTGRATASQQTVFGPSVLRTFCVSGSGRLRRFRTPRYDGPIDRFGRSRRRQRHRTSVEGWDALATARGNGARADPRHCLGPRSGTSKCRKARGGRDNSHAKGRPPGPIRLYGYQISPYWLPISSLLLVASTRRVCAASRPGGATNIRRYSRLNCEALS